MDTWQKGIIEEDRNYGLFLTMTVRDPGRDGRSVAKLCGAFPALVEAISDLDPAGRLWATISFGLRYWRAIYPQKEPTLFQPLQQISVDNFDVPNTGGDLMVHINSDRADLNFELARRLTMNLVPHVDILEEIHGFRYLDSRDLTGFIDGTANPKGEERAKVALIGDEDRDFTGGSYLLAQRYVHSLTKWEKLSVAEQEKVIGRSKSDSQELDESEMPTTAHISRVEIEEDGVELQIVRHSLPYGKATGEAGLFFIAYAKDASIFNKMLRRMFGRSRDGLHDHLMEYSRPATGEIFFTPSLSILQELTTVDQSPTT